jgi:hypothetical protein
MSTTLQLGEVIDLSQLTAKTFDSSQHAEFKNTCAFTIYIHIQWPNGGITNFVLKQDETHSLFIGTGGDPCGCYSSKGTPNTCGANCTPIHGGYLYTTC